MNKLNYEPVGDFVIIEVEEPKKKTDSGIIKPDTVLAKEQKEAGAQIFQTVAAVGKDCKYVKIGDRVLFTGSVVNLTFEGKKYFQLHEYNVLGIERL